MFQYLVKEDEFLPAFEIDEKGLEALDSEVRRSILEFASEKKVSVDDIVDELDIDRQSAYYHVEKLIDSGVLESSGKKPKILEAGKSAYYYRPEHVEPDEKPVIFGDVPDIFEGFVENRNIKAHIIVGAPYPHGEHDRRHRTSYKAGELSCLMGNFSRKREQLIYTDTQLENDTGLTERPLISVAGPLVNTLSKELNSKMPARFDSSHGKILTEENTYSGEEMGLVARAEIEGNLRMMVAGLYGIGTSAAIEALSSRASELGENGAVVGGYGTKHSIEEVEIVEKL